MERRTYDYLEGMNDHKHVFYTPAYAADTSTGNQPTTGAASAVGAVKKQSNTSSFLLNIYVNPYKNSLAHSGCGYNVSIH